VIDWSRAIQLADLGLNPDLNLNLDCVHSGHTTKIPSNSGSTTLA